MPEGRNQKVLSCASCRQRKIKCDKVQPVCTQCSRISLECVYPSRKPTRRAPRPRQQDLLERIHRLENIVGKADTEKLQELDRIPAAPVTTKSSTKEKHSAPTGAGQEDRRAPSDTSKTPSRETGARYLSDEFWANLCEEVEGIKQALEEPSDDEEKDEVPDQTEDSPEGYIGGFECLGKPSGFLSGNPKYHERDRPHHPPPRLIIDLWAIFVRNVDPLVKILHRPSVGREIQTFVASSGQYQLPDSTNALFFSVYFAAVSTLSDKECLRRLGEAKMVLASRYRMATERALAAADYLNSTSLTTLQATTMYVTMLRCYSLSLASWVLVSTVVRLGQGLNLHRDGDGRNFSPFEAEMRRRLWYFIATLDVRGAEDRGTETILTSNSYNTAKPTKIDDDDFGPDSIEPLNPKPTPADNVIGMCMTRGIVFGHIIHPHDHPSTESNKPLHTEEELIQHVRALEKDFIHTADPSHLSSRYASDVARMVILKLWLIVQYPFTAQPNVAPMRVSRDIMLRTAVSVMELSERMTQPPWANRFAWWTECFVQWHPLAVALAELCVQTEGDLADRAWRIVEQVFPKWGGLVADSSDGPLWRPIRKLYRKAKAARPVPMMQDLSLESTLPAVPGPQQPLRLSELTGTGRLSSTGEFDDPTEASQAEPFNSTDMDPSYLFECPAGFYDVDMQDLMPENYDMAPWNEFINDTVHMDNSPGSGDSA